MRKKERYSFNLNKLKGRIIEVYGSKKTFAEKMKLSEPSIYQKLNGDIEFTQSEIFDICKLLCIRDEEIKLYFFSTDS